MKALLLEDKQNSYADMIDLMCIIPTMRSIQITNDVEEFYRCLVQGFDIVLMDLKVIMTYGSFLLQQTRRFSHQSLLVVLADERMARLKDRYDLHDIDLFLKAKSYKSSALDRAWSDLAWRTETMQANALHIN